MSGILHCFVFKGALVLRNESVVFGNKIISRFICLLLCMVVAVSLAAQKRSSTKKSDPVFVDKEGVMRWTKNKQEAAFFGVNYTVPFAYVTGRTRH
jgi:hypothetical protein